MPDNEDDDNDLRDSLTRFEDFVTDLGPDVQPLEEED